MYHIDRYICSLFLAAAIAAPALVVTDAEAQEGNIQVRVYDRDWDGKTPVPGQTRRNAHWAKERAWRGLTRLLPSRCSEMVDAALEPIACAIGCHRVHRVVVRRPRRKAIHAHAKNCVWMVLV
jgi:hypothetical protein